VRHPASRAFEREEFRQSVETWGSSNELHRLRTLWTTRRIGSRFVITIEHRQHRRLNTRGAFSKLIQMRVLPRRGGRINFRKENRLSKNICFHCWVHKSNLVGQPEDHLHEQGDRRANRHRPCRRLACVGRLRLRGRSHTVRRRRHDLVSRFRDRRVIVTI
jgi:hypothetical protein